MPTHAPYGRRPQNAAETLLRVIALRARYAAAAATSHASARYICFTAAEWMNTAAGARGALAKYIIICINLLICFQHKPNNNNTYTACMPYAYTYIYIRGFHICFIKRVKRVSSNSEHICELCMSYDDEMMMMMMDDFSF